MNPFEHLIHRYGNLVFGIVRKHATPDQAEDIAQDVFLRAFEALPNLRNPASFKSWISAIAVRTCLDFWRKHYREREVLISDISTNRLQWLDGVLSENSDNDWRTWSNRAEAREILDWALGKLSPGDRMVLELIHLEEYSVKEAASLLGWSVANVKIRSFRSRRKLRKLLSNSMEAP